MTKITQLATLSLAMLGLSASALHAQAITINNFSFEADENTDSNGGFGAGERGDFTGDQLTAWIARSGADTTAGVGWRDITASELDPSPAVGGQESQALNLLSGASVENITSTAWSSFSVGDSLTLTISLGMRDLSILDWNEGTFFGLTDGDFDFSDGITLGDTVANSGLIANNPATGDQTGDGTFADASFSHTIVASDLTRTGNLGILIYAEGTGGSPSTRNQSFYDNVRLNVVPIPEPSSFALLAGFLGLGFVMMRRR